jgi:hypothetical protein
VPTVGDARQRCLYEQGDDVWSNFGTRTSGAYGNRGPTHNSYSSPSLPGDGAIPELQATMIREHEFHEMNDYDRDDASVRGDDPPTHGRPWKALGQEAELRFERLEAGNTGGVEHQSLVDRPAELAGRPILTRQRRRTIRG